MQDETVSTTIRWLLRDDMGQCMEIEKSSWVRPYTKDQLLDFLRLRNCIGMVAITEEKEVSGMMIYQKEKDFITLPTFAVYPLFRRRGVGRMLMKKLKSKLSSHRRTRIELVPRESGGISFFLSEGFTIPSLPSSANLSVIASLPEGVAQDYLEECGGSREILMIYTPRR